VRNCQIIDSGRVHQECVDIVVERKPDYIHRVRLEISVEIAVGSGQIADEPVMITISVVVYSREGPPDAY